MILIGPSGCLRAGRNFIELEAWCTDPGKWPSNSLIQIEACGPPRKGLRVYSLTGGLGDF